MFRKFSLICPVGIFLLEIAAVRQHDLTEVKGGMSAIDCSGKTFPAQPGQVAGVVDVGVGEKDPINFYRCDRKGIPIFYTVFLYPLKQSTVDEHFFRLHGRKAYSLKIRGELDGVDVYMNAIVVKKDGCSFNFILIVSDGLSDQVHDDFSHFYGGFSF